MREKAAEGRGLYRPEFEHDACGIGAVVDIQGRASHETVDDALKIVEKLEHRAGKDAEGKTGDGVGILTQIPHAFFARAAAEASIALPGRRDYGVGMFFLPRDGLKRRQAQRQFELVTEKEGMAFLGWREVPVHPEILGQRARDKMPSIFQAFVARPEETAPGLDFDRKLYVARRVFEHLSGDTYVVSLSSRTVVYKGMFLVHQLRAFYPDLQSINYTSALAIVHSRFSTNTNPSWERAHPNRLIAHNGEINTIRGNMDRMLAREETMFSPLLATDRDKVLPVVNASGSDSAMLDNTLEFLMMAGMDLPLAVMACIPEPWRNDRTLSRSRRDLYHYYATLMEPWDGPAAILFSDGDVVGAVLDRNGLRPARYYLTDDSRLILSSEVGVLDIPPEHIVEKSRLRPGKMLLADLRQGRIIDDQELKEGYAARQPYGEWLDTNLLRLADLPIPNQRVERHSREELSRLQKAFGYTYEDVNDTILPMARTGAEPTAAMGVDIPLAVLDNRDRPLFSYFKQLFAQVTNPPMDAIREEIVTDTTVYAADDGNLLQEQPDNCRVLQIHNPVLTSTDLMKIKAINRPGFHAATVSLLYYKGTHLDLVLDRLAVAVDRAYREGANIVILSDRGVDENHAAIPSLLAVSAMEQHLVRTGKRTAVSILLESAEPREVHHFAALLGYGARAVNPYLAEETIVDLIEEGLLDKDFHTAVADYTAAVLHGVVKIASKMGISTLQSYQSAQIFEAVGIRQDVIDKYFTNTVSRVGGIGLEEMAAAVERNHDRAFDPLGQETDLTLESLGEHKARAGGEDHLYNPQTIHLLQQAVRWEDYGLFKQYTALVDDETKPHTLRGLMEMKYLGEPIPLEEVESEDSIVKRFKTGAMSYGSISREAHECLAQAMNLLGGKSNAGEGGEEDDRLGDPERYSAIKQVASGRFGVTSAYLVSAREIQIKMGQGAKPGEGGHLPAGKVYPWIAWCRHSTPGVTLISPPPHHDIYSIEDLKQLINDAKMANPKARIHVKLVSEFGVGTIAAGVAKCHADVVLISGYDGGTGAAPLNAIKHAGTPWEIGLSETQQTLILNGLRSRIVVQCDGELKTGRDVVIAALLGAEEFGFATAALIVEGCVMMRACQKNTCPQGIATQDPELRARFKGKPEYVVNFFMFIAEEVREILAQLGFRTLEEAIGHVECLDQDEAIKRWKSGGIDLTNVLKQAGPVPGTILHQTIEQNHELEKALDNKLIELAQPALEHKEPVRIEMPIRNVNRTVGTMVGYEITRRYGEEGLPDDTIDMTLHGSGGQSIGAFIPRGETMRIYGEVNDYAGKGLSGGRMIVRPEDTVTFDKHSNVIAGNVTGFGATSGQMFVAGRAGERFGVRNGGATFVVEGVGDHGCEYMTGGTVVVLGPTGRNFGAGFSGGNTYVLDLDMKKVNPGAIKSGALLFKSLDAETSKLVYALVKQHAEETGSQFAAALLEDWNETVKRFTHVVPKQFVAMTKAMEEAKANNVDFNAPGAWEKVYEQVMEGAR